MRTGRARPSPQALRRPYPSPGGGALEGAAPAYTHTGADGLTDYTLHGKTVVLPGAAARRSTGSPAGRRRGRVLAVVPAGYRVAESPVTRGPYLRKG